MQLQKLELRNVGAHRHRVLQFHPRLNGIVGPNGSGKSTILNAIYAALTGDYSRLPGTKRENICQMAADDEKSWFSLEFTHGDVSAKVTRHLRPESKTTLVYSGAERPVLGDTYVNPKILEILGISSHILPRYVIVEQGKMFASLAASPAERAKTFQKLFGIEQAQVVWTAVGEWLSEQSVVEIPDAAAIEIQLSNQRQQLAKNAARIAELRQYFDFESKSVSEDESAGVLEQARRRPQLQQELQKVQVLCQNLRTALETLSEDLRSAQDDERVLQQAVESRKAEHAAAQAAIAAWTAYEQALQRQTTIQNRLEALRAAINSATAPTVPANYIASPAEMAVMDASKADLQQRMRNHQQLLSVLSNPNARCPTCGSQPSPEAVEAAKQELPKIQRQLFEITERLANSQQYDRATAAWVSQRTTDEAERLRLQKMLTDLVSPPDVSREEAEKQIRQYDGFVWGLEDVVKEIRRIEPDMAQKQGSLLQAQQRIVDISAELQRIALSPEAEAAAKERQARLTEQAKEYEQLHGQNVAISAGIRIAEQQIAAAVIAKQRADRLRKHTEHMQRVRDVLHYSNLPQLVSQRYLNRLSGNINDILETLDAGFTATPQDGLEFLTQFPDGRTHSMFRLSEGQRVMLAWAFLLAINSEFAGDLGFLVLDEPTQALDEYHVGRVQHALERLKQLSDIRGLQCIMVTHERNLGPIFDHVEPLYEGER